MKKKIVITSLVVSGILIFVIPIFLDYCVLGNKISSNVGNDVWMSFFGSYFGGLFGAFATMAVFGLTYATSEKNRIRAEKNREKVDEEKLRLSIMPCLQVQEKAVPRQWNFKEQRNSYYVIVKENTIKQMQHVPTFLVNYNSKKYFILDIILKNIGAGN